LIDLHSHVLPGLDDGARDLEQALEIARAAVAAGTATMVATPHLDLLHGVQPDAIAPAVAAIQEELDRAGIALLVLPGAEVSTERLPELTDADLAAAALGGGGWLLLECPFTTPVRLEAAVNDLQQRGFGVLLAHPERSSGLRMDPAQLVRLVEMGALTSVTASSFSGRFGDTVRQFALTLLERGLVHNVASDTHDPTRRPPGVDEGLSAAGRRLEIGPADRRYLLSRVPHALISGAVPPRPAPAPARRAGWRLRGR